MMNTGRALERSIQARSRRAASRFAVPRITFDGGPEEIDTYRRNMHLPELRAAITREFGHGFDFTAEALNFCSEQPRVFESSHPYAELTDVDASKVQRPKSCLDGYGAYGGCFIPNSLSCFAVETPEDACFLFRMRLERRLELEYASLGLEAMIEVDSEVFVGAIADIVAHSVIPFSVKYPRVRLSRELGPTLLARLEWHLQRVFQGIALSEALGAMELASGRVKRV